MERLTSMEDLRALQARYVSALDPGIPTIVIPAGTCGQASGANDLIRVAKRELIEKDLSDKIRLRITGCHGFCEMEPSVLVEPRRTFYPKVNIMQMARIVRAVAKGRVLHDLLYKDPDDGKTIERQDDIPFFQKQTRRILSRNEQVDPIRISDYIRIGGYMSFARLLSEETPESVIAGVKSSGLRGRGGAGFPTGLKWEMLARQSDKEKYLVCNADEGDPGAYMDRSVLEGNPHSIIEGMLIGAYATQAANGIIYVRNEYPVAIKHLNIAVQQAHDLGLLGENILGSGFSFNISIVKGAGAFVCGEETALIRSIEGNMGEPRQRPPFPVQKGVYGKPTIINNVETWANIPIIFNEGVEAFASIGTKNNSGTKIFSLVGKVKNTGLVEVPMGITISEIVYGIGGGSSGKSKIKAVQTGGPSGGCIPAERFDLSIDYDNLAKAGSIMGSGGMIVMDENTCMVDVAKYFMNFLKDESCGKCFTCRKGTQRMHEVLDDITKGQAGPEHIDLLEELALAVKDTTMCGLGQTASNPVLSSLRYFRDEYEKHIIEKKCEAFVCTNLVGVPCQNACPVGTKAWRYIAQVEKEDYEGAYLTIRESNPFPSVCARVCNHPCEDKCRSGTSGNEPVAVRALKRFVVDRVDPFIYRPVVPKADDDAAKIAVVGGGPAGLSAAHYLSLKGYRVTIFEAGEELGGMLLCAIPAYRLPRETLRREINSLLNDNITVKCSTTLGKDISIDDLFNDGYKAVFISTGAPRSRKLDIEGEDVESVIPSMEFLKAANLEGRKLAKGRVGVIGGGNSAFDAARVAIRQEGVESVTIYYRRTIDEMPAYKEEIDAAVEEGVRIEPLVSPLRIISESGKLSSVEFQRNRLGEIDSSGRRRPVAIPGSVFTAGLDTLIVAIGESPDTMCVEGYVEVSKDGSICIDHKSFNTSRPGVFAGGDVVTGPNTVINAVAAGKTTAEAIDHYLKGEVFHKDTSPGMPDIYIPAAEGSAVEGASEKKRISPPMIPVEERKFCFKEVELTISAEDAIREARRCLRCDLEFTKREENLEE